MYHTPVPTVVTGNSIKYIIAGRSYVLVVCEYSNRVEIYRTTLSHEMDVKVFQGPIQVIADLLISGVIYGVTDCDIGGTLLLDADFRLYLLLEGDLLDLEQSICAVNDL